MAILKELLASGVKLVHLQISECLVTSTPIVISTVLGSCVAATFHHASGMSALFHAMLPYADMEKGGKGSPCKFADQAVELIARRYRLKGVRPDKVKVKLFGGGYTIQRAEDLEIRQVVDVGRMNVESARQALAGLGFTVSGEDVLGNQGRKLYFHTATGEIWLKRLRTQSEPSVFA